MDSTGVKAEGESAWSAEDQKTVWETVFPTNAQARRTQTTRDERGIDEETLEVWAVEITGSNIGDAPVLPELLDQIPSDEDIGSVTAGGAYDTRKCHEAIAARGATTVRQEKGPPDPFRAFLTPAPARTPSCGNRQALPSSPETKPYALTVGK